MTTQKNTEQLSASYKDPSGFVFMREGVLYRQVNRVYKDNHDLLMSSGLYDELVKKKHLVPHSEARAVKLVADDAHSMDSGQGYRIIKPEPVDFVSYPYEWCFSQLKDAALLTLHIQKIALKFGMFLKDATAYNVVFQSGKPLYIDTLSFEKYVEGKPWVAYRQFCQHFIAPLALSVYRDVRFIPLLRNFLDGFPLDFTSSLLPTRTLLNLGLSLHIHAHAKTQGSLADKKVGVAQSGKLSLTALLGIIDNLHATVSGLHLKKSMTEWGDYYDNTNYTEISFENKKKLVAEYVKKTKAQTVLDLGANMGEFSRVAAPYCKLVLSTDYDPVAVEKNYQHVRSAYESKILPLILNITNPTPALGFGGDERNTFFSRAQADVVLALALVHHLAITFNLPLSKIAQHFSDIAPYIIIEFVPKDDSQVQKLLQNREDIFTNYTQDGFEAAFTHYFSIVAKKSISDSKRTLYLLKRK